MPEDQDTTPQADNAAAPASDAASEQPTEPRAPAEDPAAHTGQMPAENPPEPVGDAGAVSEALLDHVASAVSEAGGEGNPGADGESPLPLPSFGNATGRAMPGELALLSDVNLNVTIELGRTRLLVDDVLRLDEGAVVELDKLAGDPVDIFVNDRHIARGEVLVLNDNFCVRINEIVDPESKQAG